MTDFPEDDSTAAGAQMLASLGIQLSEQEETPEELAPIEVAIPEVEIASPPDFAVPRQVLADMVDRVMEVIPTKDGLPALKNVVIDVTDSTLTLTGSNSMATVITRSTAVRVARSGRILMNGTKFASVIRRTAGAEVSLRAEHQMLNIASGSSSWSLRISPVQDYPPLPDLGDLSWHSADREKFSKGIAACRFAAGSDDNDPARQQLLVSAGTISATDTRCFAQVSGMAPPEFECEMSTAAVDLLQKLLDRNDAKDFRLANTSRHMVAEIGPVGASDRMVVGHISEPFPRESLNAVQTPLAENRDLLRVSGNDLLEALRRAVPTSDEDTAAIGLRVGVPNVDSVTVATQNRYAELSTEVVGGSFSLPGSDKEPSARTVLLSHTRLAQAIRAVGVLSSEALEEELSDVVTLRLGTDRSQSRRAFVLVENAPREGGGLVRIVLNQVRSAWMT